MRTWQKLGQFRGESAFTTWLHRLAVNVVIERRRSYAIQRGRMTDDPEALDTATVAPRAGGPDGRFRARDRAAAGRRAGDFRAARRRGLQASRDRADARRRDRDVETPAASGAHAHAKASGIAAAREPPARNVCTRNGPTNSRTIWTTSSRRLSGAAVEAHVADCADCARTLDELRRVVEQARSLRPAPSFGRSVARSRRPADAVRRRRSTPRRRLVSFTMPQLAAAARADRGGVGRRGVRGRPVRGRARFGASADGRALGARPRRTSGRRPAATS